MFSRLLRPFFKPSIFLFGMFTMSNKMLFCDDNRQLHEILGVAKNRLKIRDNLHTDPRFNNEWVFNNPQLNWDFETILMNKNNSFEDQLKLYKIYLDHHPSQHITKLQFISSRCFNSKNHHSYEERDEIYKMLINTKGGYYNLMGLIYPIVMDADNRYYAPGTGFVSPMEELSMINREYIIEILDFIKNIPTIERYGYYLRDYLNGTFSHDNMRQLLKSNDFLGNYMRFIMHYFQNSTRDPTFKFITKKFVKRYDFLDWDYNELPPSFRR